MAGGRAVGPEEDGDKWHTLWYQIRCNNLTRPDPYEILRCSDNYFGELSIETGEKYMDRTGKHEYLCDTNLGERFFHFLLTDESFRENYGWMF